MDNWKNWYQNFLLNKKKNELEAFSRGLKGEKIINGITFSNKYFLSVNSHWSEFIYKIEDENLKTTFSFNDKLIFDNELLNIALVKALRNLKLIYPYSESSINLLLFKKLNQDLSAKEIIKILREPPADWFNICLFCEKENEDGWAKCMNCGKTFEDSLAD